MRFSLRFLITLPPLFIIPAVVIAPPASADAVRLLATDARGVTLRLDVPSFALVPDSGARSRIEAPALERFNVTGRPELPMAGALIAIPPGARVTALVIGDDEETLHENVALRIGMQAGFRDDGGRLGVVPTMEVVPSILDGPWPRSAVEVSEPFTVRHQSVVTVSLWPFRYDAATHRLWSRSGLTVRVEFIGGATGPELAAPPATDGHGEGLLRGALLNYEQGRSMREREPRRVAPERTGPPSRGPVPGSAAAFDEDELEVRVQLDSTGVYGLAFEDLAAHNFVAVPDSEVSVHRHEYIQDAVPPAPPYVTIELPIEVDDADADGVFGPGDRLLVFVQSWAERSRASIAQRVWGDGEVIYVTRLPGRAGLRIPQRPGWRDGSVVPLVSYPWSQRWEKNTLEMPVFEVGVTDTNTDLFLWVPAGVQGSLAQGYLQPDSFRFDINDIDTTHAVRFMVNWRGTKANGHLNWAQVRNLRTSTVTTIVDSTSWGGSQTGRSAITRTALLPGSALAEGDQNILRARGRTNPCPDPVDCTRVFAVIDWFHATYWRRFNAIAGMLSCNSAGAVGDYEIRAGGFFFTGLRIYDVTDSLRPERLMVADSLIIGTSYPVAVRFRDTSPSGATRQYVVFDTPRSVPPERFFTVERRHLTQHATGDYLLVVPEAFLSAVEPLRALRESQGLSVVVAPLESVNDEFNGGRKSAHAIKRFIRYAYRNWDAAYVLLVGDGSDDPQHFTFFSTPDWIPVQRVDAPVPVSDGAGNVYEAIPADPWYVWCVNCDGPLSQAHCPQSGWLKKFHDLFIGRLPVNSLQQAQSMVNKIVAYENINPTEAWRREMLLLADDAYSTTSFFGGGGNPGAPTYCYRGYEETFLIISRLIRNLILNEAGLVRSSPTIFDMGDSLRNEPHILPPGDTTCRLSWSGTQQSTRLTLTLQLLRRLNAGVLWWNFQGHANPSVLTHEDIYVNRGGEDDKDRLTNVGKPFLFSGFSCHPNSFSRAVEGDFSIGPSLGEDMVNRPGGGAIASWGSSGFEIIPFDEPTHLNVRFARSLFAHPRWNDSTRRTWDGHVTLGEAVGLTVLINSALNPNCLENQVGISYQLLGDPATRISIGAPQITVRANGLEVVDGEPVRLATMADTLRLEADIASNSTITGIVLERTDDGGTQTIPDTLYTLTPAFPDTARTGGAGRRYHLSFFTRLAAGTFRYTLRTLDANGVPGHFDVVFRFFIGLRADGVPVTPNDVVRPDARLELHVISPSPITSPQTQFTLTINGTPTSFTATAVPNDPTGREWLLTWVHDPYPNGQYQVAFTVGGSFTLTTSFRVEARLAFRNAFAFPNPFDDDLGTFFTFTLEGPGVANVKLRVYTVSGKMIYEHTEPGFLPGYHQIAWNGVDGDGNKLANGIYLFRLIAHGPAGSVVHEGRLVKLRKPIRKASPVGE